MKFPQTLEEFKNLYNDGKSVNVNMVENEDNIPEGWEEYAKKIITIDGEQHEYIMIFEIE